jgi:hypothetical protein
MQQKWLTVLRTKIHLVRNCTYTTKGAYFPSSPRAIISSMLRFKQAACANRSHKTAIGLFSAGVSMLLTKRNKRF